MLRHRSYDNKLATYMLGRTETNETNETIISDYSVVLSKYSVLKNSFCIFVKMYCFFLGSFLGILLYFFYGMRHSQATETSYRPINADSSNDDDDDDDSDEELDESSNEAGIPFETFGKAPQMQTKMASVQPPNQHADLDNYLFSDDDAAMRYQFPQKY